MYKYIGTYVCIVFLWRLSVGTRIAKKPRQLCLQPHQKFHTFFATRMDDVTRNESAYQPLRACLPNTLITILHKEYERVIIEWLLTLF